MTTRRDGVLAIDQGTSNTKALLVAPTGEILSHAARPVAMSHPRPGWFEQDADELWGSVLGAVADCRAAAPEVQIAGVALTNQRESVVAWDGAAGAALAPVIGWQDARAVARCEALMRSQPGAAEQVRAVTGLPLDPMFSGPKMAWLADRLRRDGPASPNLRLGTVESFLLSRLTRGRVFAAEAGNASRSLLFDLERLDWADGLLDEFGLARETLGAVTRSDAVLGVVSGLPELAGVPVLAVMADSHAALYGQADSGSSDVKITYGTGSSIMARLPALKGGSVAIATTLAWLTDRAAYAAEGNILATGAALDMVAGLLGVDGGEDLVDLALTGPVGSPLTLVPAFAGLGAPHWDRGATGLISGLGRRTLPGDLARAAMDAVIQQVSDVVEAIAQVTGTVTGVHADGGASANAALMASQADLLGLPVQVAAVAEVSAYGAARLAWSNLGVAVPPAPVGRVFAPRRGPDWRSDQRRRWREAVRRSRGLAATAPETNRSNHNETRST
jgi:glycerol kinase